MLSTFSIDSSVGRMRVSRHPSIERCRRTEQLAKRCARSKRGWTSEDDPNIERTFCRAWKALCACSSVLCATWNARRNYLEDDAFATAARNACLMMAPSGVKLAQALASRADLVGERLSRRLGELQDSAPPFSSGEARRIVCEELRAPIEDLFDSFEDIPRGSASIAQVHRASCSSDGLQVAVKVQRPHASQDALADVALLNGIAELAIRFFPKKKRAKVIQELTQIVGETLKCELDFRNEAQNARAFARAHARIPFVRVPRVIQSTKRVMLAEWIEGRSPTEMLASGGCEEELRDLVRMGVACQCAQLFETRIMHADPHPGNLLFTAEGQLAYLDFGYLLEVKEHHSQAMLSALVHIITENWNALPNDFVQMDLVLPSTNQEELARDLEFAIVGHSHRAAADIQLGTLASAMIKLAIEYKFDIPPYYSLLVRSLGMLEGIALSVDKDFKIVSAAYPYIVKRLIFSQKSADHLLLKEIVLDERGEINFTLLQKWQQLAAPGVPDLGTRSRGGITNWLEEDKAWGLEYVIGEMSLPNLMVALDVMTNAYFKRRNLSPLCKHGKNSRGKDFDTLQDLTKQGLPLALFAIRKLWNQSKRMAFMVTARFMLLLAQDLTLRLAITIKNAIAHATQNWHDVSRTPISA